MARKKAIDSVLNSDEFKAAVEKAYTIEENVKTKYGDIKVKWMSYAKEKQIFEKFSQILDNFNINDENKKLLNIEDIIKHLKTSYNKALESSFPEIVGIVIQNTGVDTGTMDSSAFVENNFNLSEMIDIVMKQIEINGLGKKISDFFIPAMRTVITEAIILARTFQHLQK